MRGGRAPLIPHIFWFRDPGRHIWIIWHGGRLGYFRVEASGEVSIALAASAMSRGIGTTVLEWANKNIRGWARVGLENHHSLGAFRKAGWQPRGTVGDFALFETSVYGMIETG